MTALNKQALLIENGQLVADTLRHLADNEIDSDYFAITSTSENGTEIEHELVITDYALQAAGTVDELTRALEAAQKYAKGRDAENEDLMLTVGRLRMEKEAAEKRIAELEANKGKPVMFIDGDISASDAEKLAAVIREMGRRTSDCSKARTVTLPDVEKWRSVDAVRAQNAYKVLVSKVLAAAGIGVKGE